MKRVLSFLAVAFASIFFIGLFGGRVFLYEPYSLPSASMAPTLAVGDYVLVNKLSYSGGAEPKRGDMVAFALQSSPGTAFIKRVIGLPGDEIAVSDTGLIINGQQVTQERIGEPEPDPENGSRRYQRYRETLPGGVAHDIFQMPGDGGRAGTGTWKVPAGHFFVMGDSRDNSSDSRFPQIGFVAYDFLIGRVSLIFFSQAPDDGAIRRERILTIPR